MMKKITAILFMLAASSSMLQSQPNSDITYKIEGLTYRVSTAPTGLFICEMRGSVTPDDESITVGVVNAGKFVIIGCGEKKNEDVIVDVKEKIYREDLKGYIETRRMIGSDYIYISTGTEGPVFIKKWLFISSQEDKGIEPEEKQNE